MILRYIRWWNGKTMLLLPATLDNYGVAVAKTDTRVQPKLKQKDGDQQCKS